MKRILSILLVLALTVNGAIAFALTGAEALGIADSSGSGYSGNYPVLRVGSRDGADSAAYVVALQNRLLELGYLNSPADGQYGSMTEQAVLKFQEVNGLTPSGIADDSTQSYLYSSSALPAPVSEIVENDALRVQRKMMLWGFMYGYADGVVGEATETAVAQFKNYIYNVHPAAYAAYAKPAATPVPAPSEGEQAIAVDVPLDNSTVNIGGYSGKITEDVMAFVDGEYSFQPYQYTVASGSEGSEVWRVQRRLRQLGYLYKPDGEFGSKTERALRYFQKKSGLPETGIADEATQMQLFSEGAASAEEFVFPYKIYISIEDQRVYIYGWDGSGYNIEVDKFKCSTGMKGYDTPTGTYQSGGRITIDEWYYFEEYNCYAKYATRIVGGVLFHSVLYNSRKQGPTSGSVRNLGKRASHGCVRLAVDDAKWIYDNCPVGTTIVIR